MVQNANITGFAEKTPILMADGTWKNIELVKQGDMVLSFDPSTPDSELEPRKVTNAFHSIERDCLEVLVENRVTVVAKDQLFFTAKSQFKPSYETTSVMYYDGTKVPLMTRKVKGGKWKIYDIEVEGTHSLVANGMRVHNKKKVTTTVVSGKVGVPLTVSQTVTKKRGKIVSQNTVTVYPPPAEAPTIVANNVNGINISTQSVPGVPLPQANVDPIYFAPYPHYTYIHDRVVNAEATRSAVCSDMLDRKLIVNKQGQLASRPAITAGERATWMAQLTAIENQLYGIRNAPLAKMPMKMPAGSPPMYSDPTLVQAALNEVAAIKSSVSKAKFVDYFFTEARCINLQTLLNRIDASAQIRPPGRPCEPVWNPRTASWIYPQCQPIVAPPIVICPPITQPAPTNYVDAKIYQTDANYVYFTWVDTTCRYEFHPPGAAVAAQTYYKHYDSSRGQYYYDRVKDGQICPAGANVPPANAA